MGAPAEWFFYFVPDDRMIMIIMMVGRGVLQLSMVSTSFDFAGCKERGRHAQKSALNFRCSA
jgi:hypothetical protein